MAGYKLLKRKGVDEVSDDFSDFSLSSPATKIRRLDAELPPIAEVEDEEALPLPVPIAEEELPNQERAIVLFKPLHHSHSPFSLTLNSNLISEIKNQMPWTKQCDSDCEPLLRSASGEEEEEDKNLALVPWVPSSRLINVDGCSNTNTELMEADEMEASMMMDVEQDTSPSTINPSDPATLNLHEGFGGVTTTGPEGFHQWQQQQQQHCMLPQLPQNTSTPITWTR